MVSKGQIVDLKIDAAAYKGLSVGRLDELVIFVRNAVPGDRVQARIVRKKRNYAEAVVEEILETSPHRTEPRCRYFGICGGCTWQNSTYEHQLLFKQRQVEEIFSRLANLDSALVHPTIPSPEIYNYRNKMEFSFGACRWLTREEIASGLEISRDFALGLHIPKRWDRILDLQECHLQSQLSTEIVNRVRHVALDSGWSPYDASSHIGYLRNLVIRTGTQTDEVLVNLVTFCRDSQRMKILVKELLKAFPEITTIVNTVNPSRSPTTQEAEEIVYHGEGTIRERIGNFLFTIKPDTFFQPNTAQAEGLCRLVEQYALLDGNEIVYDLYSGSGSLTFFLANQAEKVVGIESQARAVEGALQNAADNEVRNCVFLTGQVGELLDKRTVAKWGRPQVIIADPPRSGMHKGVCQAILQLAPERVVYVSCNPATQARDLGILCQDYEIEAIQPVDMFPQTYHIENVVSLRLE